MLSVIAAIVAGEKKRTGWAAWCWVLAVLYVLCYLTQNDFTGADFFKAGWFWLIVTACIKKKEPDVVVHNYVNGRESSKPNYYTDAQGTEYYNIDMNARGEQWSGGPKYCPECGAPLNASDKFCTYCGKKLGN